MKILIDLQGSQSSGSRFRGIGRYSLSLTKAIIRNKKSHEIVVLLNEAFPDAVDILIEELKGLDPSTQIKVFATPTPTSENTEDNLDRTRISEEIRALAIADLSPDFTIITSLFEGHGDDVVTSVPAHSPTKTAIVLYDLIPYLYQEQYLKDQSTLNWYQRKIEHLQRADILLAISDSSRNEAISYLKFEEKKIINISSATEVNTVTAAENKIDINNTLSKYSITRPFLMYTGGIDWRKNIDGLIQAYAKLPIEMRESYQLAIVCHVQESVKYRLMQLANNLQLKENDVILTGYVTDTELSLLYKSCTLFIFPSLHEGFGLPVLEAMTHGAPVIGSNCSSIPEVIGKQDALFDPKDTQDISYTIFKFLNDPALLQSLKEHAPIQANKFSWDNTAKKAIESIEKTALNTPDSFIRNIQRGECLPSLAVVSPLPPSKTGVADYMAEIIPNLSTLYQITIVTPQQEIELPVELKKVKVISLEEFRKNPSNFQRVLYQIGNSEFHIEMLSLLKEIPGVIVLHDFYLSGIYNFIDEQVKDEEIFLHHLFTSHGYRGLAFHKKYGRGASILEYPCNYEALKNSIGIIVHSKHSLSLSFCYGKETAKKFEFIAMPKSLSINIGKLDLSSKKNEVQKNYRVCVFGIVEKTKQIERIIKCWLRSSLSKNSSCMLYFVGEISEKYLTELTDKYLCGNRHVNIHFTNRLESEKYNEFLQIADLAIQLRADSRGETSKSLLDCLSQGIPTIINANGSLNEIPEDICIKLPDIFTEEQLIYAIETIYTDGEKRKLISSRSKEWVGMEHNPDLILPKMKDAIERFYSSAPLKSYKTFLANLEKSQLKLNKQDISSSSHCIFQNRTINSRKRIYIDISSEHTNSFQHLKRSKLISFIFSLVQLQQNDYFIEPIYFEKSSKRYKYARKFMLSLIQFEEEFLEDDYIEPKINDILLTTKINKQSDIDQDYWFKQYRHFEILLFNIVSIPSLSDVSTFYDQLISAVKVDQTNEQKSLWIEPKQVGNMHITFLNKCE